MFKVEELVRKRIDPVTSNFTINVEKISYFVKWEGYDSSVNTWEP